MYTNITVYTHTHTHTHKSVTKNRHQHNAKQCNALQHSETCISMCKTIQEPRSAAGSKQCKSAANHAHLCRGMLYTLQRTATHCNTLQHTATR